MVIAVCLAGVARLHMKEQVNMDNEFILYQLLLLLLQLRRQARERSSYGKGVTDILVKPDSSLPTFVALMLVSLSLIV